jgi:hypothetical protein
MLCAADVYDLDNSNRRALKWVVLRGIVTTQLAERRILVPLFLRAIRAAKGNTKCNAKGSINDKLATAAKRSGADGSSNSTGFLRQLGEHLFERASDRLRPHGVGVVSKSDKSGGNQE